jgi:hypothetical protein
VIDENIGIFIKHSSKRMTPWRFTFLGGHISEIQSLLATLDQVFLLLICGRDGVVCLDSSEWHEVILLDGTSGWISATRHRNEMYSIKGSKGDLRSKVGPGDFPSKLFSRS